MRLNRKKEREAWTAFVEGTESASSTPYSKYRNEKALFNGRKFDSKHEASVAANLQMLEARGLIKELEYQVPFILVPKNGKLRAIVYRADFVYRDPDGTRHILDAKGFKTQIYRLKKRLMFEMGYEIEEV